MGTLPMFPLGSVLLPGSLLPLHVFEPRYRALVRDCLDADRRFGVVLIERGSEVGGGDVRASIGTVARIVDVAELPDGRFALTAVGTDRLRVTRWLDDDPYPRAEVEDWPDPEPTNDLAPAVADIEQRLRRILAMRTELGDPSPPVTSTLPVEWRLATYQAAALAPLGPADRQALLASPTLDQRIEELRALFDEEISFLLHRLAVEGHGH